MKKCPYCEKRIWPWQNKGGIVTTRHLMCHVFKRMDILSNMITELNKPSIPPSPNEIKEKGYIGWSMTAYIFYRMEDEMTHEQARDGAFLVDGNKVFDEISGVELFKKEMKMKSRKTQRKT